MSKHTPGPWEYNKDNRWPNCLMAPKGAPGALSMVRVAQMVYVSDADKALIEAAPELLEALKIAVQALRDNDIDESMAGEFEILTDAIAKAEGGAP